MGESYSEKLRLKRPNLSDFDPLDGSVLSDVTITTTTT